MQMTSSSEETFGKRLKRLRNEAGMTQKELAAELGISRRTIDYYEREGQGLPAQLLPDLARILGVEVGELLGIQPVKSSAPKLGAVIEKRLRQIEKLNPKIKKQILQILDTFIEAEKIDPS